jgi:hypothetical protein
MSGWLLSIVTTLRVTHGRGSGEAGQRQRPPGNEVALATVLDRRGQLAPVGQSWTAAEAIHQAF